MIFDLLSHSNRTEIEDYIRRLSPDMTPPYVTFIHMGFYYQNFTTFFVPDPTKLEFRYPILMNGRIPFYDVRDTGKVVRECFRCPDRCGHRQIIPIVAEQLTMEEICTKIREVTDREINFIPLAYEEALLRLHPETVNYLRWYNEIGSIDQQQAEKTHQIWPKMIMFADWLRENRWLME